jgi:DNA-directed RNA polymerase specialized sigma24 family protein
LSPKHRDASAPSLDEDACQRLLDSVRSTAEPEWRKLVGLLWPVLMRLARESRTMTVLGRSDDHVRNVALLVLEKLGRGGCRVARLERPWREARPGKTTLDWLRIVVANVARDYVRERAGRAKAGAAFDKRLVYSLATALPDEDELPPSSLLSATTGHAARELVRWAEEHLPADQTTALGAWLEGESFEAIAATLAVADVAVAKRLVHAALATLRRHASAA